jgi:SpoVK/Ycf46/Vps4 family AAA+-type ATPase
VKQEITTLVNYLSHQQQRRALNLPTAPVSLHMLFLGNPGTGKTTVARIFGQMLGALGVLPKGHLVETDRSGLVAEYAGQTGPKTQRKIDAALGGVLFIDEAYSLAELRGEDTYGREALQTLLKRMEDDRHRLAVILAGYPRPMQRLLKVNPGLASRIATHLHFPDYQPVELARIFQTLCEKNHYRLPAPTRAKLLVGLDWLYAHRDERFGNGRLVRNVFERAVRQLANRVAGVAPVTVELLTVLQPEDIVLEGLPAEVLSRAEDPQLAVGISCPGCQCQGRMRASRLGAQVQCKACGHTFVAEWGDLRA